MQLRTIAEEDLEQVLLWRNEPGVRKNMYTNHLISWKEHKAWFENVKNDHLKRYFIFYSKKKDLGVINFTDIDFHAGSAFWGFYASKKSPPGTGLMMEYCALKYAFDELRLHKLNCEVIEFNKSVINMHKKYGFKVEGTFRDYCFDGKRYHDVVRLGITENEWEEARPSLLSRINDLTDGE